MRFRAVLKDSATIHDVCDSLQKIQKLTLVKLSATKIRLAATSAFLDNNDSPYSPHDERARAWVSIPTEVLFATIHIESKRKNEIYCLVKTSELASALRQGTAAHSTATRSPSENPPLCVKLSKDGQQPVLVFSSAMESVTQAKPSDAPPSSVTYSIPVQVIGDEGPELAQIPSIDECVRSLVLPQADVLHAFCAACHSVDEPLAGSGEVPLVRERQQPATLVMKIDAEAPPHSNSCVLTFFSTHDTSSLRCVFRNVSLLAQESTETAEEGTELFPEGPLYYAMKPNRLAAVLRALCKAKKDNRSQSILHCTRGNGLICSAKLQGDVAVLYHIPCVPVGE